jgi:flagellar protein FlaJ
MAAQIKWGVPADEALRRFSERVNTSLVNRVVAIIIKANDAGGNVADVLNMVSRDAKQIHMAEDEQKIAMTSYLAVIYISYAVFIVVIIILNTQFLSQMAKAGAQLAANQTAEQTAQPGGAAGGGGGGLGQGAQIQAENIPVIKYIFALAVFAHGIGDGIVAGVLQTGKITNGMKHSFVLILLGFVALRIMFGGLALFA